MVRLNNIIREYISTFKVYSDDNNSYVLLYLPYAPFEKFPKSHAVIDSYYIYSNKLYQIKKEIEKAIVDFNPRQTKSSYQSLFIKGLGAIKLKSGLVALDSYGTRLVLEVIEIDKIDNAEIVVTKLDSKICSSCNRCLEACPTKAISSTGFNPNNCIRSLMDSPLENKERLVELNAQFLGCEICQNVCPYNREIKRQNIPPELLAELEIDALTANIESGKKSLSGLASYIGNNYIRPERLKVLANISKLINEKSDKK